MDTVAVRLSKYQRRLRLQTVVAATLLAEVTVFSAVKFSEAGAARSGWSVVLGPVFLTVIILAGSLLALARGKIEWQADLLTRYLSRADGGMASATGARLDLDMSIEEAASKVDRLSARSPGPGFILYVLALLVTLAAGFLLVVYVWLPVFAPPTVKPAAETNRRVEIVGLPISVYFDVDRSLVSPSMQSQVEALARRVQTLSNVTLLIEGHADSDYRSDYNLELSRRRAEAVKGLLMANGLDPRRITVVAYGETRPRAHEPSLTGKAQNRRVDISLLEPRAGILEPGRPSP